MRRITKAVLACTMLLATVMAGAAGADAGDLDPTFDGDGIRTLSIAFQDLLHDVGVDSADRVYLAGESALPRPAGVPGGTNWAWTVTRLTADGALDPTFADGGTWIRHFGLEYAAPTVIVPQPDGTVLVGGYHSYGTGSRRTPLLVRLDEGGRPDPTFGQDGVASIPPGALLGDSTVQDLLVQPDGRILTVGRARTAAGTRVALARHLPDGSRDPAFGQDGQVVVAAPSAEAGLALASDADGRVVVAGTSWDGRHERVLVLRLDAEGQLDPAFASGGRWTGLVAEGHHRIGRVAVGADRAITVSGHAPTPPQGALMLLRLTSDGVRDDGFGQDGAVLHAGVFDGRDLVVTSTTTTVTGHGQGNRMSVLRVLGDGSPDPTFGAGGRVDLWVQGIWGRAVALDGRSRLVVAGHDGYDLGVVRMAALTGCGLQLEVPAVVPPDTPVPTTATWWEASGLATSPAGVAVTTTISPAGGGPAVGGTVLTDGSGRAVGSWVAPPGEHVVTASAAGDDRFEGCVAEPADVVVRGRSALVADPVLTGARGGALVVSATLTSADSPLPGRTLRFSTPDGQPLCSAVTGADGRGGCTPGTTGLPALLAGYEADFEGDVVYEAARATGTFLPLGSQLPQGSGVLR